MRICINAAAANQGGAVTHLTNLLPNMAALENDDHFLVIAPQPTLDRLADVLQDPRFEFESYPYPPVQLARRITFDQVHVPMIARRYGADLLFSSNGFGSLVNHRPEALLIRNPVYFSRSLEQRLRELGRSTRDLTLRRTWSALSVRAANAALFPTKAMEKRVQRFVSLKRKTTRVLHYGFDRQLFFSGDQPEPSILEPIQAWRASGRRILLYVSGYAVHKNFETGIESLARLLDEGIDLGLVLTASWKPFGEMAEFDAMLQRIRELGIEEHVYMPGQLAWPQLHAIYAAADIHFWPTFLESFGHPMVEAMASGLPSVAADTDVNREILQDAASYFAPFDHRACADSIRKVMEDHGSTEDMKRAAVERAGHFSWRSHAESLSSFFSDLISKPKT
ncbi:glycosyltransferase [Myxococcota bacterium]|nr:glycosyltransferase [Myxococcota bacterium]